MKFKLTFTGIDESIVHNIDNERKLFSLSFNYPFIEWGVLYSSSRSGNDPRYPSLQLIYEFVNCMRELRPKTSLALHLCGAAAITYLTERGTAKEIEIINKLVDRFDRIQLNINAVHMEINNGIPGDQLAAYIRGAIHIKQKPHIVQYNGNNHLLLSNLYDKPYIHILKDASGGAGLYSTDFSIPESCKNSPIGFAGGFGPDNIEDAATKIYDSVMSKIVESNSDNKMFWIDMESKVRTDNNLDFYKVDDVSEKVEQLYFNSYRSIEI